ncbi:MAG: IS1595 family transposase [Chitinophagaceae bacterium]|nr:MAG: IS1595 family transposase [Chitinophagaceae bacterium]
MDFKNLKQLFDTFKDEATCKAYLEQQRWNGNVECPFCGATKVYRTNRGFKCADKFCAKKFTVTVGTIFENSKVGLVTWFAAIYLATSSKKGISSLQLSRQLGITQKTAWFVLHRIREMLRDKAPHMLNNMVEVDETYIGGKMKNKHKRVRLQAHVDGVSHTDNKTCVVALLERGNKVKTHVHTDKSKTLKDMVRQHVNTEALVVTDSLNAYKGLAKEFAGHEIVNHNQDEYVRGNVYTNTVEGFFSILKRGIYGIYHQVSPKHLQRYCDEFASRYNTREIKDHERFVFSLKNAEGRLKYTTLIGK